MRKFFKELLHTHNDPENESEGNDPTAEEQGNVPDSDQVPEWQQ